MHDRLACGKNAFGVRVRSGIGQVADHVLLDFFRCIETKDRQVADVELDDLVTLFLHLARRLHHRPANVVANVGQLGRFGDGFEGRMHGGSFSPFLT